MLWFFFFFFQTFPLRLRKYVSMDFTHWLALGQATERVKSSQWLTKPVQIHHNRRRGLRGQGGVEVIICLGTKYNKFSSKNNHTRSKWTLGHYLKALLALSSVENCCPKRDFRTKQIIPENGRNSFGWRDLQTIKTPTYLYFVFLTDQRTSVFCQKSPA